MSEALIVIDVQNDFCPGGALAVPDGDAVVPVINRLQGRFGTVVLTQDWHPADHGSFASQHRRGAVLDDRDALWRAGAVARPLRAGDRGRGVPSRRSTIRAQLVIRKGFRAEIDSYSAFFENDRAHRTGLAGYLRERGDRGGDAGRARDGFLRRLLGAGRGEAGFPRARSSRTPAGRSTSTGRWPRMMGEMRGAGVEIVRGGENP